MNSARTTKSFSHSHFAPPRLAGGWEAGRCHSQDSQTAQRDIPCHIMSCSVIKKTKCIVFPRWPLIDWLAIRLLVGGGKQLPFYHFISLPSLSLIVFTSTHEFSFIFTSDFLPCLAGVGEASKWLTECLVAGWVQPTTKSNSLSLNLPRKSLTCTWRNW